MSTEEVWNKKLKKPAKSGKKSETVALINLKGFNDRDNPVELSDIPGTVEQLTVYDKPTGRMGLKDYINADLAKVDNELFAGFSDEAWMFTSFQKIIHFGSPAIVPVYYGYIIGAMVEPFFTKERAPVLLKTSEEEE